MQEVSQCGLVTPYVIIKLCQYSDNGLWSWFGQWLEGTKLLLGPISTNNQCDLMFRGNTQDVYPWHEFENYCFSVTIQILGANVLSSLFPNAPVMSPLHVRLLFQVVVCIWVNLWREWNCSCSLWRSCNILTSARHQEYLFLLSRDT